MSQPPGDSRGFLNLKDLKHFINELPPKARNLVTAASVSALLLTLVGSPLLVLAIRSTGAVAWIVTTVFAVLAVVTMAFAVLGLVAMLMAVYHTVRSTAQQADTVERVAEKVDQIQEKLQFIDEPVPPGFHVGCRIGRRRLECGVLEVTEETTGVPTSLASVKPWSDGAARNGRLSDGALLSEADHGLFEQRDLYAKLAASIAESFRAVEGRGLRIASIGIAIPGGVYPDRGTFDGKVDGVPFGVGEDITERVAESLLETLGGPTLDRVFGTSDPRAMRAQIHLDNDARCAARWLLVEMGPSWEDFVCIFAGSGLGSGLVFDREIFYGNRFRAGEVGHVNLNLGSRLLLADPEVEGKSLQARHCSCGKDGYHFESLVGIGGLGHLAQVINGDKLNRIRDAYNTNRTRHEQLKTARIDDDDADGMIVLRSLAAIVEPVPQIAAQDPIFVEHVQPDRELLALIRSTPIRIYLTLVARQFGRLFGTGIAALLDALDVDHIALCGTVPEYLRNNIDFDRGIHTVLPDDIPGWPREFDLEYGSMLHWGWRGAALLPRDPGYRRRRFPYQTRSGSGG